MKVHQFYYASKQGKIVDLILATKVKDSWYEVISLKRLKKVKKSRLFKTQYKAWMYIALSERKKAHKHEKGIKKSSLLFNIAVDRIEEFHGT